MSADFVFSSESVTRGHPDKLCDQVSDAIVGRFMRQDPFSRVVAECATSTGIMFLSVKYLSDAVVDVANVARSMISEVGYTHDRFNARNCTIMTSLIDYRNGTPLLLDETELDDSGIDAITVGDQATVFGFACTHTPTLMPLPIWLANRLARRLDDARLEGDLDYLAPDGKVQVAIEFRDRQPKRIHGITLVAAQRKRAQPTSAQLEMDLREQVLAPVFEDEPIQPDAATRIAINPEGPIIGGGPYLHAGLTGHKGGADTYGEFSRQGGSSLSGKDPSRIDRVAAYAARHAAKNVVAAGLASQCEVQLSYSIGLPGPVSVQVETFGTARSSNDDVERRVRQHFDFRLGAIVRRFQMRRLASTDPTSFYPRLAAYGQVGRTDVLLPWEATDMVEVLNC